MWLGLKSRAPMIADEADRARADDGDDVAGRDVPLSTPTS